MKDGRLVTVTVAVAIAVLFAGCPTPESTGVIADVQTIQETDDGGYTLELAVENDRGADVENVTVRAFSYAGRLACTIDVGDLETNEESIQTTRCEKFPAFLVPESEAQDIDSDDDPVPHQVTVYNGLPIEENEYAYHDTHNGTYKAIDADGNLDAEKASLVQRNCQQFAFETNRYPNKTDYSIVDIKPWDAWGQKQPMTRPEYKLNIYDATYYIRTSNTTSIPPLSDEFNQQLDELDPNPYNVNELHPIVSQTTAEVFENEGYHTTQIQREEYYGLIQSLSGTDVSTATSLPTAYNNSAGWVTRWDHKRIICGGYGGPKYRGERGESLNVRFVQDGRMYVMRVELNNQYRGLAVEQWPDNPVRPVNSTSP